MKKLVFFILVITLSSLVFAVSVSPPSDTLRLTEDFEGHAHFVVGQLDGFERVRFTFSPEIFPFDYKEVNITGNSMQFKFPLSVKFDSLEPGRHKFSVIIKPMRKNMGGGQAAVRYKIIVEKPYDTQYLRVGLHEDQYSFDDFDGVVAKVESLGNVTVEEYDLIFQIFDKQNNLVLSEEARSGPLELNDVDLINFPINLSKVRPDIYDFVLSAFYGDGKSTIYKNKIKFGDVHIEVINLSHNFTPGKINNLLIDIDSRWNDDLENVRATYRLKNGSNLLATADSPTINLRSWYKGQLTGYIDLTNVNPGVYDLEVDLRYVYNGVEKQTLKTFEVEVKDENIFALVGFINYPLLLAIISVLVILFALFRNNKKDVSPTSSINVTKLGGPENYQNNDTKKQVVNPAGVTNYSRSNSSNYSYYSRDYANQKIYQKNYSNMNYNKNFQNYNFASRRPNGQSQNQFYDSYYAKQVKNRGVLDDIK